MKDSENSRSIRIQKRITNLKLFLTIPLEEKTLSLLKHSKLHKVVIIIVSYLEEKLRRVENPLMVLQWHGSSWENCTQKVVSKRKSLSPMVYQFSCPFNSSRHWLLAQCETTMRSQAGQVAQRVRDLLCEHKDLSSHLSTHVKSPAWQHIPVIPALVAWRQEDARVQWPASSSKIMSSSFRKRPRDEKQNVTRVAEDA